MARGTTPIKKDVDEHAKLSQTVWADIEEDLGKFFDRARFAAFDSDGKMNASFTLTVGVNKSVNKDGAVSITMDVNSRMRMPNTGTTRAIELGAGEQLRLI